MIRGVNKQLIFEEDDDKKRLLMLLEKYKDICHYQLYSYCLMDNHVHLLIREVEDSISELMKRICSSYVYWYNMKYERIGHLFQERFKSETVSDRRYFLTVLRYIHQNPLKAGLASNVFESKWTSIHEYIHGPKIIDTDFALNLLSNNRSEALRLFIEYMQQVNDDVCLDEQDKVRVSDREIKEYLSKQGVTNANQWQRMKKEDRDDMLANLKRINGVSVRQLSRITGISKSVIGRIDR